jgi:hypothetical protein
VLPFSTSPPSTVTWKPPGSFWRWECLLTSAQPSRGITWGKGFDWETVCLDVTPVSYAQLGLLPQMQRTEADVYSNLKRLLAACGRPVPPLTNVPNRYLAAH